MTSDEHEAAPTEIEQDCGCDEVYEHLFEYLDSEMTVADLQRIRKHLDGCEPCLSELSVEELVRRVLRRACVERAPENLRIKIMQRLRSTDLSLAIDRTISVEIEK